MIDITQINIDKIKEEKNLNDSINNFKIKKNIKKRHLKERTEIIKEITYNTNLILDKENSLNQIIFSFIKIFLASISIFAVSILGLIPTTGVITTLTLELQGLMILSVLIPSVAESSNLKKNFKDYLKINIKEIKKSKIQNEEKLHNINQIIKTIEKNLKTEEIKITTSYYNKTGINLDNLENNNLENKKDKKLSLTLNSKSS